MKSFDVALICLLVSHTTISTRQQSSGPGALTAGDAKMTSLDALARGQDIAHDPAVDEYLAVSSHPQRLLLETKRVPGGLTRSGSQRPPSRQAERRSGPSLLRSSRRSSPVLRIVHSPDVALGPGVGGFIVVWVERLVSATDVTDDGAPRDVGVVNGPVRAIAGHDPGSLLNQTRRWRIRWRVIWRS